MSDESNSIDPKKLKKIVDHQKASAYREYQT
jgi:hypothetical protein